MTGEYWHDGVEDEELSAAYSYLSLLADDDLAAKLVKRLRHAETELFAARDLLRASALPLLERDNAHVASALDRVRAGGVLSAVLLVRGRLTKGRPLVIANGYHRLCAGYWIDADALVPGRVVDPRD